MRGSGLLVLVVITGCVRGGFEVPSAADARSDQRSGEGKPLGDLHLPDSGCSNLGGVVAPGCSCGRADLNHDGEVGVSDLGKFSGCWCQEPTGSCAAADLDGDGRIDRNDLACLSRFYGRPCTDGGR